MNYLQLAQALKRESGLAGTILFGATGTEDVRLFNWINWAARDITLQREDWRFRRGSATLASTVSATNTATDFGLTDFASWKRESKNYQPTCYRVADGVATETPLEFMEYDQFRAAFLVGSQTASKAQYWTVSPSESFLIGPAPDSAHYLKADYIKDYTEMTLSTDTPIIPTRFHMMVVWRAMLDYGEFDSAGEVQQRAIRNYNSMWTQMVQSQLEQPSFAARSLA